MDASPDGGSVAARLEDLTMVAVAVPLRRVDAAFDTNVVLEISTLVDLDRAASTSRLVERVVVPRRRARARASLAAAWLCHIESLTTLSLAHEVEELLKAKAPSRSVGSAFPWFFTWFLLDRVLGRWTFAKSDAPSASDFAMGGNARDRLLVSLAAQENVPVVTNEGKPDGAIARAAAVANVTVLTPSAWIASRGGDEMRLAADLLAAAREAMPAFLIERGEHLCEIAGENCEDYLSILELILDPRIEPVFKDPLDGWKIL